jgi:hypothetical protein
MDYAEQVKTFPIGNVLHSRNNTAWRYMDYAEQVKTIRNAYDFTVGSTRVRVGWMYLHKPIITAKKLSLCAGWLNGVGVSKNLSKNRLV